MSTITKRLLIDDVDGGDAEESLNFGLDGVTYEIDLSGPHADELRAAFEPWVAVARRTGGRRAMGGRAPMTHTVLPDAKAPVTKTDRLAVIRFAKKNGLKEPAMRGRIASDILAAWEEAGRP